jgi:hypothetical protein
MKQNDFNDTNTVSIDRQMSIERPFYQNLSINLLLIGIPNNR